MSHNHVIPPVPPTSTTITSFGELQQHENQWRNPFFATNVINLCFTSENLYSKLGLFAPNT